MHILEFYLRSWRAEDIYIYMDSIEFKWAVSVPSTTGLIENVEQVQYIDDDNEFMFCILCVCAELEREK